MKRNENGDRIVNLRINIDQLKRTIKKGISYALVAATVAGASIGFAKTVDNAYSQEQQIEQTQEELYQRYLNGEIELDSNALDEGEYIVTKDYTGITDSEEYDTFTASTVKH